MRKLLLLSFMLFSLLVVGQDKVYLLNNQVVEGTVTYLDQKHVQVNTKNYDILEYHIREIVLIVKDGKTTVIPHNSTKRSIINKDQWSIGLNLTSPLISGVSMNIDKRFKHSFSLEFRQTFGFDNGYNQKIDSYSTFLVNGYLGGHSFINMVFSTGLGFNYQDYLYPYYDYISYQPINDFYSYLELYIPIGVGLNVNINQHLGVTAKIYSSFYFDIGNFQNKLDIYNSGITFYYKF